MSTKRIKITLPEETARKLRKYIPRGLRSRFIAKVLAEKLYGKDGKPSLRK